MTSYSATHRTLAQVILLAFLFPILISACSVEEQLEPERFSYTIVNSYPHDPMAFIQGLAWDEGNLYEGTGKLGRSSMRRVELASGKVIQKLDHKPDIFAEGITVFKDHIYQLTWKNNLVFKYDKHTFSLQQTWKTQREGWGITHDNKSLIVSDGSATLYFLDPETLVEKRRVTVHNNQRNIGQLNELEYVNGMVYANIWHSNLIAMINPVNGAVVGWIDLSDLYTHLKQKKRPNVLNGIVYDQKGERLFVTGKYWATLFEIRLVGEKKSEWLADYFRRFVERI